MTVLTRFVESSNSSFVEGDFVTLRNCVNNLVYDVMGRGVNESSKRLVKRVSKQRVQLSSGDKGRRQRR